MKTLALLLVTLVAVASAPAKSVTWKFDNLKRIGGLTPEILGEPRVIKTEKGKAIEFDGVDDGIFMPVNPLAGATAYTIEAIFRPASGGAKEQRWLHVEDTENTESRALLETRLVDSSWFLDAFGKSGDNRVVIFAENFKHPLDQWFTVTVVFDGKELREYVDGKLELSGKFERKPFGKGKTSIGVRQNKVYWFKGAVKKARFTDRALQPNEFLK